MIGKATFHTKTLQDAIAKNRERLHGAAEGCAVREFKPLKSWPATVHQRQAEIDAFQAVPSRYA